MTQLSKFSFNEATTYTDGTTIPAGTALTYTVAIDTVNPPVKTYAVPAAQSVGGVITVTFAELGFTPVNGTTYYAAAFEASGSATSAASNEVTFTFQLAPSAPTGFIVA